MLAFSGTLLQLYFGSLILMFLATTLAIALVVRLIYKAGASSNSKSQRKNHVSKIGK